MKDVISRGDLQRRVIALGIVAMLATLIISPGVRADACDEPNDTPDKACPIAFNTSVTGTIGSATDVDAYKFAVTQPDTTVIVELTDLPQDYDLYLANARGGILGQSVREGTGPERIQLTLAPGTYYIYVQVDASRYVETTSTYTLRILADTPPPTPVQKPTATLAAPVINDPSQVGPPPALGDVVFESALNLPGLLNADPCPTGRGGGERVEEGFRLRVSGECGEGRGNFARVRFDGLTVPDGEIRLEFKMFGEPDQNFFYLWYREQANPNRQLQWVGLAGPGRVYLWRFPNVPLAGPAFPEGWSPNDWNSLAIRLDGPKIWVLVNDRLVLAVIDAGSATGQVTAVLQRVIGSSVPGESAIVMRNLRISRLANGDDSRAPTFR